MSSLLFSAIVAVVEVKVDRRHVPKVDFREFQELKAQNDDSQAKSHIQRRCSEAGMVVACHLGGRLGMECGLRWLGGFLAQSTVDVGKSKPRKCR